MNTEQQGINDGGPAFPISETGLQGYNGMSLRDWFAGKALIGVESCYSDSSDWQSPAWCREAAIHCYEMADAMLAARSK